MTKTHQKSMDKNLMRARKDEDVTHDFDSLELDEANPYFCGAENNYNYYVENESLIEQNLALHFSGSQQDDRAANSFGL